ncbi:MAG: ligand-binding SRPBCC domain-containing protein [Lentimonas sp.]|jgi:ligand-binding SRPBCC domain-containing protein
MAKIHQLYREQIINTDIAIAWDFISSPKNLDAITPDDMPFEIITDMPDKMYDGLLIEYRVGIPIIGRQTWLTELKHIRPGHSFVDEQRIGPYKLWCHYHEITLVPGGVRFIDRVSYVLPCGPFGAIAHLLYVKKQLKHVFDYREVAMREQFVNDSIT